MNSLQITFGVLLVAALLATVIGYPRKYGALSGRSRLFRTTGMGMIDLLLVILLVFVSANRDAAAAVGDLRGYALRQAILGLVIAFLTLSLMALAALDVLENLVIYRRERRQVLQDMIRAEIEAQAQKRAEKQAGGGTATS